MDLGIVVDRPIPWRDPLEVRETLDNLRHEETQHEMEIEMWQKLASLGI